MPSENSLIRNIQIENGMVLPALEGRLFCSRRDPVKESEVWYQSNQRAIESAGPLVVLGLGAGFHLLQIDPDRDVYVIELRPELIEIFERRDLPVKPRIHFVGSDFELEATVLEFRPAWMGIEEKYQALSRRLRAADGGSLQLMAEKKDLWVLSEVLNSSPWPKPMELSVKEITKLFPLENQTQEAKIWRALRELVA